MLRGEHIQEECGWVGNQNLKIFGVLTEEEIIQ
jgi:hypothetical protein